MQALSVPLVILYLSSCCSPLPLSSHFFVWLSTVHSKFQLRETKPVSFLFVADIGSFDFIIVGGGAAGTLLANRLTQVTEWKILLLEAGETENDFSNVPAFNCYLRNSPMNWGYFTKPQNNSCQGNKGQ